MALATTHGRRASKGKEGGGHITTLSPLLGLSIGLVTVYSDQSSNNKFIKFQF